jgi:hypothetical protein
MVEGQSDSSVTADQEQATPNEDQEQTGQGVTEELQQQPQDDYYKNKAFELERKNSNLAGELSEIKDLLKNQQKTPANDQVSQYTEAQLKAALSNPDALTLEQQQFARNELEKIESKKQEERDKRLLEQIEKKTTDQQKRQAAEQAVKLSLNYLMEPSSGNKIVN